MTQKFNYNATVWGTESVRPNSLASSGSLILDGIVSAFIGVKGKVLDVGCGGGQFSRGLQNCRPDLHITAVDIGKDAITYAQKTSSKIKFIPSDARHLPFAANSFNAVFSIETIEHIREMDQVIREINRVLIPGGKLYLSVSCEGSLWTLQGLLNKVGIDLTSQSIGHINKITYRQLIQNLEKRGFKITRKFYFGHLIRQLEDFFYVLYLAHHKKNPGDLWNTYKKKPTFSITNSIFFLFQLAIILTNIESKIFRNFPGISIQIEAIKK